MNTVIFQYLGPRSSSWNIKPKFDYKFKFPSEFLRMNPDEGEWNMIVVIVAKLFNSIAV